MLNYHHLYPTKTPRPRHLPLLHANHSLHAVVQPHPCKGCRKASRLLADANMSSNNYKPYSHSYQQSSAQQYAAYHTASAANNIAQPAHQYKQPPTTQAQDYMSYEPQSYANHNSGYGTAQDNQWGNSNYGGTRETTRGAAEVLRSMSNSTPYTNNAAPTNAQPGTTAINTASSHTSRYAAGSSHSPLVQAQLTNCS